MIDKNEIKRLKRFKTDYKTDLEVLDHAIPQLKTIAHLYECVSHFTNTVGINADFDSTVVFNLSNLMYDVTSGIEAFCDKRAVEEVLRRTEELDKKNLDESKANKKSA